MSRDVSLAREWAGSPDLGLAKEESEQVWDSARWGPAALRSEESAGLTREAAQEGEAIGSMQVDDRAPCPSSLRDMSQQLTLGRALCLCQRPG